MITLETKKKQVNSPLDNAKSASGYRSIFRITTILGGVQVFNIVFTLIRAKLLAVLIGTAGMGLNGLLMSSLNLIQKFSGLGLSESAVRDISIANSSHDDRKIIRTYSVFKHWIWLSALIGMVITIFFSPILSRIAFKNGSYTIEFLFLSVTFLFGALTGGIHTLLRGLRRIKELAKANIAGSFAGLIAAVPFFYFFGINGVVPAIIATSVSTYLVSVYFKKKVNIDSFSMTLREFYVEGKPMVKLGITLSLAAMISSGIKFTLDAFITKFGDLSDLGIYSAGEGIMTGYVGMVFAAMGTDYYPRLAGVIDNSDEWKYAVNQQAEIVILILGPVLTFILFSAPILIKILLTEEFLPALCYITWASIAVLIKGLTWVSGYVIIAKADNKVFLLFQIISAIWTLSLNLLLYYFWGITGLGISMVLSFVISLFAMFLLQKRLYGFVLSKTVYKLFSTFSFFLTIDVLYITFYDYPRSYIFTGITFVIALLISLKGLDKRLAIMAFIKECIRSKSK